MANSPDAVRIPNRNLTINELDIILDAVTADLDHQLKTSGPVNFSRWCQISKVHDLLVEATARVTTLRTAEQTEPAPDNR